MFKPLPFKLKRRVAQESQPPPVQPKSNIQQFSNFEERDLWRAFVKTRSLELRNLLFERYAPDAIRIANQYRLPERSLCDIDDLRNAALKGLVQALEDFDVAYGVKFIIFARKRIYGELIDELRRMMDFPRVIAANRRALKVPIEKLHHRLGREPTNDEICSEYGEGMRKIISDPLFKSGVFNQYQNSQAGDEESEPEERIGSYEWVEDNRKTMRRAYERAESREYVLGLLQNPDHKQVILGYYYLSMTDSQIAGSLIDTRHPNGKSTSTATNVRLEALRVLKKKLGPDGRKVLRQLIGLE